MDTPSEIGALTAVPQYLLQNMHVLWSFILVSTRYLALFLMVPGLGGGLMGLQARVPGVLVLACVSMLTGQFAEMPVDWYLAVAALISELLFGAILGMIPRIIISGVQAAGQLSATTMGLNAGSLIDPALGMPIAPLSRVFSDLATVVFFLVGGHRVMIKIVAGMDGTIVPGTFVPSQLTVSTLIERSGEVFTIGVLLSAPVVVALLVTQFVMGLISKAIPSVNVFVVSFPLTVSIGLILTIFCIPGIIDITQEQYLAMDEALLSVLSATQQR